MHCSFAIILLPQASSLYIFVTDPVVACVSDTTVDATSKEGYTVTGNLYDPFIDENCSLALTENNFNNKSTLNGATLPDNTSTTIRWLVGDVSGNLAFCLHTIHVNEWIIPDGISSLEAHGISLYPNPTDGKFIIEFAAPATRILHITDMTGKEIMIRKVVDATATIDLTAVSSGVYIIKIEEDEGSYTGRIIVK